MHKHILKPHRRTQTPRRTHKHSHTYSPFSLCVFHRFYATLWESDIQTAALAHSRGGKTRITMCGTTSVSTRSEFQIKRTPFFYEHSLIASPSLSSFSLPPPIFSDTIPFNSSPLSNSPHQHHRHLFPPLSFLLFFCCTKCFKFIICILWCMGTIMFFIMEKWERFIFVTGLFHNSFFKLVL